MTTTDDPLGVTLELRFFATFREAVGTKSIERGFDAPVTVGDVLQSLEDEFPDLAGELLDDEGSIRPQLSVLQNGRQVFHLDGTETALEDGDQLSVFPPVAGG